MAGFHVLQQALQGLRSNPVKRILGKVIPWRRLWPVIIPIVGHGSVHFSVVVINWIFKTFAWLTLQRLWKSLKHDGSAQHLKSNTPVNTGVHVLDKKHVGGSGAKTIEDSWKHCVRPLTLVSMKRTNARAQPHNRVRCWIWIPHWKPSNVICKSPMLFQTSSGQGFNASSVSVRKSIFPLSLEWHPATAFQFEVAGGSISEVVWIWPASSALL